MARVVAHLLANANGGMLTACCTQQPAHPSLTTCMVTPASSKREVDSTCSSATWAGGAAVAATRSACRPARPWAAAGAVVGAMNHPQLSILRLEAGNGAPIACRQGGGGGGSRGEEAQDTPGREPPRGCYNHAAGAAARAASLPRASSRKP